MSIMKRITIGLLCLLSTQINAQVDLQWANSSGGTQTDQAWSIHVDGAGNVLSTGVFTGTADFNPGVGVETLVSNGVYDIYIQKVDANGSLLWAKALGGSVDPDRGYSIVTDASNNVYVCGFYSGTVDFNPGVGVFNMTANGSTDPFVLKLNASGIFVWAKSFGNVYQDQAYSISVDLSDNIYISGFYRSTVDFDPGASVFDMTATMDNSYDAFLLKLSSDGNFIWAKSFGGTGADLGYTTTIDSNGDVVLLGYFNGFGDFDPGSGVSTLTTNGNYDVFIVKMEANGDFLWAKSMGGTSADYGRAISTDASGNIYSTGIFNGTADFDPSGPIVNLVSNGSADVFVQKLDTNGNFIWAKSFGGSMPDNAQSINIDPLSGLYLTGYYTGTVDFDPGVGINNLTSFNNGVDIFIEKLDTNGNFLWVKSMGTNGSQGDLGRSITTDPAGNIYVTGNYGDTVDFDPNAGVSSLASNGLQDVFVIKLSPCIPDSVIDTQTACDSYTWIDGMAYTSSNNTATHILTNAVGCDSLITLNLTVNYSTSGTDAQTACDSYTWIDGITYTSSNVTATQTLTNAAGCDSVVTLNLTMNYSTSGADVQTACDSYTWIDGNTYTSSNSAATHTLTNAVGCDSIVTLNLTLYYATSGTDVQTACDSYTWIDGNTYTSSNSAATHTLTNSVGCDSIVTLNLTINYSTTGTDVQTACDSYTWIDGNTYTSSNSAAPHTLTNAVGCDSIVTLNLTINTVDVITSAAGLAVTANAIGATYQWLDCDNNYSIISGETNQTFTATINGNYAVEVMENGCVDTSSCVAITTVGLTDLTHPFQVRVYPNPTISDVTLEFEFLQQYTLVYITDLRGQEVYRGEIYAVSESVLPMKDLSKGIYFIHVDNNDTQRTVRVIKN